MSLLYFNRRQGISKIKSGSRSAAMRSALAKRKGKPLSFKHKLKLSRSLKRANRRGVNKFGKQVRKSNQFKPKFQIRRLK